MTSISSLAVSFARAQKAEGRSPHTIKLYRDCINRLVAYTGDDLTSLTRRNLLDFYAIRSETVAPATVWTDYKVHRVFTRWLCSEEEIGANPMDRIKPPRQPIVPVPVLSEDETTRLLAACSGSGLRAKRDRALIAMALDTGCRRGELSALRLADLDLEEGIAKVTGKGKTRLVAFTPATAAHLDRYLRKAPKVVGERDGSVFDLTPSGISQMVRSRAAQAGIDAHCHQTRHTWAHRFLAAGGGETDLMTLAGWSPGSRSLLDRYGASARTERAIAAYRRITL